MADSNIRKKDTYQKTTVTTQAVNLVPPLLNPPRSQNSAQRSQESASEAPGSLESHSPSPSVCPQTRDSGYNTDVSPATTSSPATNATARQHFSFENVCHVVPDQPAPVASPFPLHAFSAPRSPHAHVFDEMCDARARKRSTPPLRLSPEIFKIAEQRSASSPRLASESSGAHGVVFDFDIDEDSVTEAQERTTAGANQDGRSGGPGEDVAFSRDGDMDENLLYSADGIMKHWGQDFTSRGRASSFCLRHRRRHCSTGDNREVDAAYWGDVDEGTMAQRSFSFSESFSDIGHDYLGHRDSDLNSPGLHRRSRFSPLFSSQGFQSGCNDCSVSRSESCDSENVFTFDPDVIEDDARQDAPPAHRPSASVPIVREKPPHSPASTSRIRRRRAVAMTSSHLHVAGGVRLPCSGTVLGVSVSTQTPHVTSTLIQELLSSPVALPNESIGPAASSLRRRSSASGALPGLPISAAPLPDIVPTTGRDRSNSVPDFHAYERAARARETGRQVGRELRRMSDEFNVGSFNGARRLSPVNEDLNGYSSSFPITRPRWGLFHHVRSLIQENLVSWGTSLHRRDSSVDLAEQSAPEEEVELEDHGGSHSGETTPH